MERTVTVVTDVKDVSDFLNGACLEQIQVAPLGGTLQFTAELTRAMMERQTVVRQGWRRKVKTPWTKCQLVLRGVRDATVCQPSDHSSDTPLLCCDAIKGGYRMTIQVPQGLQLVLNLEHLDGEFSDVGSPTEAP